jgi:formylglycine-generating enzyme required for sulfatase activity
VSWFDAARFANWMTNGQGGPETTETGAYTLNNATSGNAVAVNPGAAFRLPTENEWYKAAYYSPTKDGAGGYYAYATQSNDAPSNTIGSGTNQANWNTGSYSVTGSDAYYSSQNYLTDVGAFSDSGSSYGTFDQSGNVYQWNDLDGLASSGEFRGLRGGYWFFDQFGDPSYLSSSYGGQQNPTAESNLFGFRLVGSVPSGVPEIDPTSFGSALAMAMGSLAMLERRARRAFSRRTAV